MLANVITGQGRSALLLSVCPQVEKGPVVSVDNLGHVGAQTQGEC